MTSDIDLPNEESSDEESLEQLSQAASPKDNSGIDVDEDALADTNDLPGADLSGEHLFIQVLPIQDNEFICSVCFLAQRNVLLADAKNQICVDCA